MLKSLHQQVTDAAGVEPSRRLTNALRGYGILTLREFMDLSPEEAITIVNLGDVCQKEFIKLQRIIQSRGQLGHRLHNELDARLQRVQDDLEMIKRIVTQQIPSTERSSSMLHKAAYLPTSISEVENPALQLLLLGYIFQ